MKHVRVRTVRMPHFGDEFHLRRQLRVLLGEDEMGLEKPALAVTVQGKES